MTSQIKIAALDTTSKKVGADRRAVRLVEKVNVAALETMATTEQKEE